MTIQMFVGAALFFVVVGCAVRANLLFGEIVTDINRLVPEEQAISLSGFVRHRFFAILTEYRRLYPDGKLIHKFNAWAALGFACFIGAAVLLG